MVSGAVRSQMEEVFMDWIEAGERDARTNESLVGIFRSDNEAIRAMAALRQRDFSAQQVGVSSLDEEGRQTNSAKDAGKWFGELRDIFHEDTNAPTTWRPENLERLLVDMGIQSEEAARIAHYAGPQVALIVVRATDRWREAKVLVEEFGGRTEIIHSPGNGRDAEETQWRKRADGNPAGVHPDQPRQIEAAKAMRVEEPGRHSSGDDPRHVVASTAIPESSTPPAQVSAPASGQDVPAAEPGHIQLYGEELRVHKEKVGSGEVRVRKESVTEMQTVEVPVTREHLVVEHTDRSPASRAEEIRVPLTEERVRVEKDLRLREEFKVGKHEITENKAVTESLRRERLLIDHDAEMKRD